MKYGFNIDASQTHIPLELIRSLNAPYHLVMTAPPGGISDSNAQIRKLLDELEKQL